MNIAILSRGKGLYSTRRLAEETQILGHTPFVIDYSKSYMTLTNTKTSLNFSEIDDKIHKFDAVIPRIGGSIPFYGTAVVRQFETMKVYTLNSSLSITRARDKIRSLQILTRKGMPIPNTAFAHSPSDINGIIKTAGGVPLIIKLIDGSQGGGVVIAETKQAAKSVIQAFWRLDANIIVQEFIKESKGSDLRCVVLGNKVVAAMTRHAGEDDFRSNIHSGGVGEKAIISDEERDLAINATKSLGLKFSGVDILRSNRGPLILEVNSSPGLEGIEKYTQINVARQVIQFIEKEYTKHEKDYQG